jgi:hypothetical protein
MVKLRKNKLSVATQAGLIKAYFPDGNMHLFHDRFVWKGSITPTPISRTYTIKLTYSNRDGVNVYVVKPKPLPCAKGKSSLPHVYSQEKQRLCLYLPGDQEWDESKHIAKTIIPWTSEWLFYYELWMVAGEWLGGGIHPKVKNKRITK